MILRRIIFSSLSNQRQFSSVRRIKKAMDIKNLKIREDPVVMKLNDEIFQSLFTDELNTLHGLFNKHQYEVRIAGGAVRDILMGKKPTDLDFATEATPEEMKRMFEAENIRMINMNGEKHGTITARINDKENFECTTLRIDLVTDGRHAEVEFTKDWMLDAGRRDLTINAMFLGFDGNVYDYFYGYEDLKSRTVRFVGDANERIQEDYLRTLRYFRFYGKVALKPDNHDSALMKTIESNASGLSKISGERIWTELRKILQGNFADDLVCKIVECGLSESIGLPKESNTKSLTTLWSNRRSEKPYHPITLLSSLLNSPAEALSLHERLKFSAYERDLLYFITSQKSETAEIDQLKHFQQLCVQPSKIQQKILKEYVTELLKFHGNWSLVEDFEAWEIPRFPVSGNMLKLQNFPPGKIMGEVMNKLKEEWVKNNFESTSEELLSHIPRIREEIESNKRSQVKRAKFD